VNALQLSERDDTGRERNSRCSALSLEVVEAGLRLDCTFAGELLGES
jgi:hypothetical protein